MKVYLNAGHGLTLKNKKQVPDPGAVGPTGLHEADITLDIAARAGHLFRLHGTATCGQDRADAARVTFQEAAKQADAAGADLLVSIHCNAAADLDAHGCEVWYHHDTALASAQAILRELIRQIDGGASRWLPARVPLHSRGVKRGTFHVIVKPRCPAVLVEVAFISHPGEEAKLKDRHFRQAVAQAIVDGALRAG